MRSRNWYTVLLAVAAGLLFYGAWRASLDCKRLGLAAVFSEPFGRVVCVAAVTVP